MNIGLILLAALLSVSLLFTACTGAASADETIATTTEAVTTAAATETTTETTTAATTEPTTETTTAATEPAAEDVFYDDFSGDTLDETKWIPANRSWGGWIEEDGVRKDYNGGVVPANVSVRDGKLILTGHGNRYTGDVPGIWRDGSVREDGIRTGACVYTREFYGSGTYEVYARISPEPGGCSAIWTFEWEQEPLTGHVINHEIDIELPGRPGAEIRDMDFDYALCNTWIGEESNECTVNYQHLPTRVDDGEYHLFRFDWHTGDKETGEKKRVDFYLDGEYLCTSTRFVPTNPGQLWLGLWFPLNWAGEPDFDTSTFEIDWVRITPYHESGDTPAE